MVGERERENVLQSPLTADGTSAQNEVFIFTKGIFGTLE